MKIKCTMKHFGILHDEVGFYAFWEFDGKRIETLRTENENRADLWLLRGLCHGARNHDSPCDDCRCFAEEHFNKENL